MAELTPAPKKPDNSLQLGSVKLTVPALITEQGKPATKRFIEFFKAHIRIFNACEAYGRGARDFFAWCDGNSVGPLIDIEVDYTRAHRRATLSCRRAHLPGRTRRHCRH